MLRSLGAGRDARNVIPVHRPLVGEFNLVVKNPVLVRGPVIELSTDRERCSLGGGRLAAILKFQSAIELAAHAKNPASANRLFLLRASRKRRRSGKPRGRHPGKRTD